MQNIEKELDDFYKSLKKHDEKLTENLGLDRLIEGLDSIIGRYKLSSDPKARESSLYDFSGAVYDMMKAVKDYRLARGMEMNIKANPINLRKEDLIFKSLIIEYNHLKAYLNQVKMGERKTSNK